MNAIGALILIPILGAVFFASRRGALLAVLAGVLYLTQGQGLVVLGFNLFAVRIVALAGFARVMSRREFSFSKLNSIDRIVLLLYGFTTIVFLLRSSEGQAYQIGTALDAYMCYFMFRGLLVDFEDFKWVLRAFLVLLIPYVFLVLIESLAGYNIFTVLGGIDYGDWERAGRPRCQGSFRHPSLLGTLGGSFLPLYIGLRFTPEYRKPATIGIILCLAIVWASNSGGPVGCVAIGMAGWMLWRMRTRMQLVRRGAAVMTIVLALVMKAPIWYLLTKASALTGGGGYHRSYLLEVAFNNLDKWWLAGMPIAATGDWFPYKLSTTGAADITNQMLSFGLTAGMGALILFFVLLIRSYSVLGKAMAELRLTQQSPSETEYLIWGLGAMLMVHIFNWQGITYFDQTIVLWFMQLAAISTLAKSDGAPVAGPVAHAA